MQPYMRRPFSVWRLNIFSRAGPFSMLPAAQLGMHVFTRPLPRPRATRLPQCRHLILVSVRSLKSIFLGLYAICP